MATARAVILDPAAIKRGAAAPLPGTEVTFLDQRSLPPAEHVPYKLLATGGRIYDLTKPEDKKLFAGMGDDFSYQRDTFVFVSTRERNPRLVPQVLPGTGTTSASERLKKMKHWNDLVAGDGEFSQLRGTVGVLNGKYVYGRFSLDVEKSIVLKMAAMQEKHAGEDDLFKVLCTQKNRKAESASGERSTDELCEISDRLWYGEQGCQYKLTVLNDEKKKQKYGLIFDYVHEGNPLFLVDMRLPVVAAVCDGHAPLPSPPPPASLSAGAAVPLVPEIRAESPAPAPAPVGITLDQYVKRAEKERVEREREREHDDEDRNHKRARREDEEPRVLTIAEFLKFVKPYTLKSVGETISAVCMTGVSKLQ